MSNLELQKMHQDPVINFLPLKFQTMDDASDAEIDFQKLEENLGAGTLDALFDTAKTTSFVKLQPDMRIEETIHSVKINEYPTIHLIPESMLQILSKKTMKGFEIINLN